MAVATESLSPSSAKPRHVVEDWLAHELPIEVMPVRPSVPLLAHDREYVRAVLAGERDNGFGNRDLAVAESLRWTNGAVMTATMAMVAARGPAVAVAPCSGFHHAHFDHQRGFCTFNGLADAALRAATELKRSAILDCDFHFGDGTEDVLAKRDPAGQVRHWSAGKHYTHKLQAEGFLAALPGVIRELTHLCPVVLYQAGADQHVADPLGGLLTTAQMKERDRIVFTELARLRKRVVWTLAGGYQAMPTLLELHRNTLLACIEVFGCHDQAR